MWFQKLREYLANLVASAKNILSSIRLRWLNMRSYNMSQAIDYFDIGMLDECHTRLKIILKIWPKNEQARYLLGLTCVCGEETEEALKYLNYVDGHYQEQAQRLIRIIESGMSELVVKKYLENTSLFAIENEIKEILL